MSSRRWWIMVLVVLLGLLVACGGGETPVVGTPTQVGSLSEATAPPTEIPTPELSHATVVDVINEVNADPLAEGEWQDAEADMAIYVNGQVWAQEASTARVEAEEGLVRVAPNTLFTFEQPDPDTLQLNLDEGQVWVNVEGLEPGQTFQVETPAAVASVRGTRFGVRTQSDGMTVVSTKVGTVTVSAVTHTVTVPAGFVTVVQPGNPPSEPAPMCLEEQVRWGMALGDELGVVLPAIGVVDAFTFTGFLQDWSCSFSGNYLAFSYYDPAAEAKGYVFHDLQAGVPFTAALPSEAYGVAFNPASDKWGYLTPDSFCTVDVDGTNPTCFDANISYLDFYWSPDGEWLLFYPYIQGMGKVFNLFKIRSDGSDMTQLTYSEEGYNRNPAWSPDGSLVAYTFVPDYGEPAELWVVGADGSNPRMMLQPVQGYNPPAWSPDGSLLAVPGYGEGEYGAGGNLWLVPLDGSEPWILPGTEGWSCHDPVWSPTDDGWPLFFSGYDEENKPSSGEKKQYDELYGIWWYTPDSGVTHFANIGSGPGWCLGEKPLAIFSSGSGTELDYTTEVHVFQLEPDFWS